jgi:chemotaxis regulatin CheY-phosphate phosphatase CheZ
MPVLRIPEVMTGSHGSGPAVPGIDSSPVVSGQDDIDALLASVAGGPG